MRDTDWKILYELYRNPNITKAAQSLYMTQPTLTKRLQYIEEEFDARIVIRSSKGVEFTQEGIFLAEQAEKYLNMLEETRQEIAAYKEESRGTIVIGAAYSYSRMDLPDILYSYNRLNPWIQFEVHNESSSDLVRLVSDGVVDVGFMRGDYEGPVNKKCVSIERGYILTHEKIELEQLKDLYMIDAFMGNHGKSIMAKWWEQYFENPPKISMKVGYAELAWQLIGRGMGYGYTFLADNHLEAAPLYKIPMLNMDGTPIERRTWFLYTKSREEKKYIKDFIEFVNSKYVME